MAQRGRRISLSLHNFVRARRANLAFMPLFLTLILRGIALGISAAAPIGPVNVEIARRTLRGGFRSGFALGCGAVSVDVLYAVLSSLSLRELFQRPAVVLWVTIAGTLFLLYLAFLSLRGAARALRTDPLLAATPSTPPPESAASTGSLRGAYLTGVLMTLLNPMTLGFWFVAVPAVVGSFTEEPRRDLPMICAGVFVGTLGWVVFFAGVLAWAGARARRPARLAAVADAVGGITLLGFALLALWRLRGSFL